MPPDHQAFPFLKLPKELRLMIYSMYYQDINAKVRLYHDATVRIHDSSLNLEAVCKLIRSEAKEARDKSFKSTIIIESTLARICVDQFHQFTQTRRFYQRLVQQPVDLTVYHAGNTRDSLSWFHLAEGLAKVNQIRFVHLGQAGYTSSPTVHHALGRMINREIEILSSGQGVMLWSDPQVREFFEAKWKLMDETRDTLFRTAPRTDWVAERVDGQYFLRSMTIVEDVQYDDPLEYKMRLYVHPLSWDANFFAHGHNPTEILIEVCRTVSAKTLGVLEEPLRAGILY